MVTKLLDYNLGLPCLTVEQLETRGARIHQDKNCQKIWSSKAEHQKEEHNYGACWQEGSSMQTSKGGLQWRLETQELEDSCSRTHGIGFWAL